MATIVAAAGGGNWTVAGTWTGGVVPTAADDVQLTATSGNVTINAAAACRSLNCTGYTATLLHAAAVTLTLGDTTAGLGNVALMLVPGMAYTLGNATTSAITFASTSTTVQTITTGGEVLGNWTVNGTGSKYQLTDTNTTSSTAIVTLSSGQLDTNGQTCSWGSFNSSSGTRTLTLGSSAISVLGSNPTPWSVAGGGLTLNAGTSSITVSTANPGGASNWGGSAIAWNNVTINLNGIWQMAWPATGVSFANLTINGSASKACGMTVALNGFTVTGTFTVTGNSAVNRVIVQCNPAGTGRTITAANVALTNVDFVDIAGAGAAAPFTGTSLGDALGNSGIAFTPAVAQTWQTTGSGNWSDATKWTSRVPLPQDSVSLVKAFVAATITLDMPRAGKSVSFSGSTGSPTLTSSVTSIVYGTLDLTGVGFANIGGSGLGLTLAGRSTHTLTTPSWNGLLSINAPGGTYTLGSDFPAAAVNGFGMSLLAGTLNGGGFNFSAGGLTLAGTASLILGSGTWTFGTLSGTFLNVPSTASVTANTSTIILTGNAGVARTFAGGGKTYNILTYTVANSPGALAITGANTFNNLNVGSGRILTMLSSTVNTISPGGSFNVNGVSNSYLYLPGVASNYASAPDSVALSVASDIDIRVKVAMDDWTPAAQSYFAAKGSGTNRAWDFGINTTGALTLGISPDGVGQARPASTVATGLVDGSVKWVRATWDDAANIARFYTSDDGATWTQLGANVGLSAAGIFDSTGFQAVGIWGDGVSGPATGKFYRAQIRNNILDDGSGIVFDADFTTKTVGANSFVESSANAATVTITGTAAQAGDGRVLLNSSTPGTPAMLSKASGTVTSDYITIQDSTATGGAAWYAGANSVNVSGNSGWIFGALGATATQSTNFLPFFGGSF